MWAIVDATFRPLHRTTASVGERSEQDLREVDAEKAPREVQPLVMALNRLLQRIRNALQTERRFTADAAHELRTPLAAIRANAQVLIGARDQAEREATARDLLASVDRSTRLVEQLLALARADQPLHDDKLCEVDIADVAREQLAAHRSRAEQAGINLRSELASGCTRADPALLSVMVRNLLDNALRYTPPAAGSRWPPGPVRKARCSPSRTMARAFPRRNANGSSSGSTGSRGRRQRAAVWGFRS